MVNMKEIKPFNKVWLDCDVNRMVSLFCTIDPKYEVLAYDNRYTYFVDSWTFDDGHKIYLLIPEMSIHYNNDVLINEQNIDFTDDDVFVQKVVDAVNDNKYVLVGVDLFYWIENSLCWQKSHWYHWSFIQGYDSEREVFQVIDDSKMEYGYYEVSKERFLLAIRKSEFEKKARIFDVDEHIDVDPITTTSILKQADEIVKALKEVSKYEYFWMKEHEFKKDSFKENMYQNFFQIEYRHKANLYLFEAIEALNLFDQAKMDEVKTILRELMYDYFMMRPCVLRLFASKRLQEDLKDINAKMQRAFEKEINLWAKVADMFGDEEKVLFHF